MKIISILNQKGGSGKTTLAMNVATALKRKGFDILLVDSDNQASLREWHAIGNNEIPVVGLDRTTLDRDIKGLNNDKDFIIIDGAPSASGIAVSAIKISDFVLIPVQPSSLDLWATTDLVEMVKNKMALSTTKAGFVINRAIKNTNLSDDVKNVLNEQELPCFQSVCHQRVVYATCVTEGKTVFECADKSAILEIENLTNELLEMLED